MNIQLRESKQSDLPFLRKMLYEAVFWKAIDKRPSFEEAIVYPEIINALANWGERDGDTAVIATIHAIPVGAAWYRYWTDSNNTRGYFEEITPVVAIGVHHDYRHRGIGTKMIARLIDNAAKQAIQKISLCVSKDNYAINLYRQQGFSEHIDDGNSIIMVRNI